MENKPKFALIGAAGFVAPRHMKAIKEVGGELVAALDPHDSVGILDRYFPHCQFFTEFERFDRYCSTKEKIDYVSICSPNYLHDAHCRFALRIGADAICEKPLVIKPRNLDSLQRAEEQYGRRIWSILQLRHHPELIAQQVALQMIVSEKHEVELRYFTPRGDWYQYSWKGDVVKSGGVAFNIGVHLFDLLVWLFGKYHVVHSRAHGDKICSGSIEFGSADVTYYLSIHRGDLSTFGGGPRRVMKINGENIEFSNGFTDLHTISYQEILDGRGFGIDDTRGGIELCAQASQ